MNEDNKMIMLSYHENWRNRGLVTRHIPSTFKMFLNGRVVTISVLATGNEYVGFKIQYQSGYLLSSKPRVDRKLIKIKSFLGSYFKYAVN